MEKQIYKNSKTLHIPEDMKGVWTVSETGFIWELTSEGINNPVNHTLYPNPVTPDSFLVFDKGTTTEITGENFYSFFGSARFEYKDNFYYGELEIVIDNTGDAVLINGMPGIKG